MIPCFVDMWPQVWGQSAVGLAQCDGCCAASACAGTAAGLCGRPGGRRCAGSCRAAAAAERAAQRVGCAFAALPRIFQVCAAFPYRIRAAFQVTPLLTSQWAHMLLCMIQTWVCRDAHPPGMHIQGTLVGTCCRFTSASVRGAAGRGSFLGSAFRTFSDCPVRTRSFDWLGSVSQCEGLVGQRNKLQRVLDYTANGG